MSERTPFEPGGRRATVDEITKLSGFLVRCVPRIGGASDQNKSALLDVILPEELALPQALLDDPPERVERHHIGAPYPLLCWDALRALGYEPRLERESFKRNVAYVLFVDP